MISQGGKFAIAGVANVYRGKRVPAAAGEVEVRAKRVSFRSAIDLQERGQVFSLVQGSSLIR